MAKQHEEVETAETPVVPTTEAPAEGVVPVTGDEAPEAAPEAAETPETETA